MITIISGPVKAGKSKYLIEKYEELMAMAEPCQVFSSKFSLNQGETIQSRYGTTLKAISINSLSDIKNHLKPDTLNIFIDEFQFLEMHPEEVSAFFKKYYHLYDFYIFGLDLDYRRNSFKIMNEANAWVDILIKKHANCDICGELNNTKYSMRLEDGKPADIKNNGKVIILDGEDLGIDIKYQSTCDSCWRKTYGV